MTLVYSCCFWFSLRLGGILIGLFSIFQGVGLVIGCCMVYAHSQALEDQFNEWSSHYNLIYSKQFISFIMEDLHKYITLTIVCTVIYLIASLIYIYGAYICSNMLMVPYLILELCRLFLLTGLVATGLLLLKENTMDIGNLIGASVVGGFFLLGMFYLWVCAANLPLLINEMERDSHAATVAKLEQLLQSQSKPKRGFDNVRYGLSQEPYYNTRDVFIVSNKNNALVKTMNRSKIPVAY